MLPSPLPGFHALLGRGLPPPEPRPPPLPVPPLMVLGPQPAGCGRRRCRRHCRRLVPDPAGVAVAIAGIPSVARTGPPAARTQPAAAAGFAVDGTRPAATGVSPPPLP